MKTLELTVTEEHVKRFLNEDIVDFYDDPPSAKSYVMNIFRASDDAGFPLEFPDVKGDFRDYLQAVRDVRAKIWYTLTTLGSPGVHGESAFGKDKDGLVDEHYQALIKLVDTYNKGVELLAQDPLEPMAADVTHINEILAKQIFIVNMLYNPQKSEDFRLEMGKGPQCFDRYVTVHMPKTT